MLKVSDLQYVIQFQGECLDLDLSNLVDNSQNFLSVIGCYPSDLDYRQSESPFVYKWK